MFNSKSTILSTCPSSNKDDPFSVCMDAFSIQWIHPGSGSGVVRSAQSPRDRAE